jgi:hypothetical protein
MLPLENGEHYQLQVEQRNWKTEETSPKRQ